MTVGPEFPSVLEAARTGAEWAWRVLYRDLAPTVLGYLRLRTDAPEDTCADVFCEVVRRLPAFDGDEPAFRAWVFILARHRVIDDVRRRSRRPELLFASTETLYEQTAPDDVERDALDRRTTEEIKQVLSRLPETQRDVLLLRLVAGLSVEEVAHALRKRNGAVRALQHRAIKSLKKILDAHPDP